MARGKRIERGIYQAPDGRFDVIVLRKAGGRDTTRPLRVDTLAQAKKLVAQAEKLRSNGGDVEELWTELRGEKAVIEDNAERTVRRAVTEFITDREELMETSDHRISGLNTGVESLRPDSFDSESSIFRGIAGRIGHHKFRALDNGKIRSFVRGLALEGYAIGTQTKFLMQLRQLGSNQPVEARPSDFPWKAVKPVPPTNPKKREVDFEIAGLNPGDPLPALMFADTCLLAAQMRSCAGGITYVMMVLGVRRGEAGGIQLGDLEWEQDRIWVSINSQRATKGGAAVPWLKTQNSARRLPLPRALEVYVLSYLARYHPGYDLRNPDPQMKSRYLAVTSTGRESDGSFIEISQEAYANWWKTARKQAGFAYKDIGYDITPHHLRRSLAAYLCNCRSLVMDLYEGACDALDAAEADPALSTSGEVTANRARVARLSDALVLASSIGITDVGAWLGHSDDVAALDGRGGSKVTIGYGRRSVSNTKRHLVRMAELLDVFLEHEAPNGFLDLPDEHDSTPVIARDDPNWLLINDAAKELELTPGALHMAIRDGKIEGHLVYYADADRQVPGRRHVIGRYVVDILKEKNASLSALGVERLLRVNRKSFPRLIKAGLLTQRTYRDDMEAWYRKEDAAAPLAILLDAVVAVLDGTITLSAIRARFITAVRYDFELALFFPNPTKIGLSQVGYWVDLLVKGGIVERCRNGAYRAVTRPSATTNSVAAAAASREKVLRRGRPVDPKKAYVRRRPLVA